MKKAFLILAVAVSSLVCAAGGSSCDRGWQPGPSSAWFVNWDKAATAAKKSGCLDGRPETRQHLRGESLDSYLQRIREILDRKPAKTGETTISPQSRAEGGVAWSREAFFAIMSKLR